MKSFLLLAMGVSLTTAAEDPLTSPLFYTNAGCTGAVLPASKLWSYASKDKVAIKPFATPGALSGFTIDTCMTDDSVTYSVMLRIDDAACPNKGEESLLLAYWKNSKTCEGTAQSTTLTAGVCSSTPLGSVKFEPSLTSSELCVVTNFIATMQKGGVRTRVWAGNKCSGSSPIVSTVTSLSVKGCGAQPECTGCCPAINPLTCAALPSPPAPKYVESLTACNNVNGKWDAALVGFGFSDAKCTAEDNGMATLGLVQHYGTCANGKTLAMLTEFVPPLTIDLHCQYVELYANKSVDGYLSWSAFREKVNSAPSTHPVSICSLLSLFVIVLLF
eukprot:TRINITY_DN504_c0_g1_i1.p1 TRINITY_DN504_c0_g1~~TRINITY_DN504_c0_g1_i1.p1  ORF type:complete len:351 (+),score=63.78 TRINITY_DN504_c0_g1_i1:63-1055(+)